MSDTGVQSSRDPEFLPQHPISDQNFFPDDNSYLSLLLCPRVYKVHGTPKFFPTIQFWTRICSLLIILIFASRPLNKGKNCIFTAFLSLLSSILLDSITKHAKNTSKMLKIGGNAQIISPFLTKVRISYPPLPTT